MVRYGVREVAFTYAQEPLRLSLEGGGAVVGRVHVMVDVVAQTRVLLDVQRLLVERDERVEVEEVAEKHAQEDGVVRGLDGLLQRVEARDHRLDVHHVQVAQEKETAELGVMDAPLSYAKTACNVLALLDVGEHGVDQRRHHVCGKGGVQSGNEFDDNAV